MNRSIATIVCSAAILALSIAGQAAPPKHHPKPPHHAAHAGKVVTTKSGLKYTDIKLGKGPVPHQGQSIVVDYTGTLMNGTVFDSSHKPGRTPFSFVLGAHEVIPGWEEGVANMRAGGVRKLIIPSALAYGDAGRPPVIPPKATLIFIVELHKIE